MAIVFLALNGEGLGHLVRATIVCRALFDAGERPILFSQGVLPLDDRARLPATHVPSLWKAPPHVRRRVASALAGTAQMSLPAIVLEDTHPNPISLPSGIRRVLLVRPTRFRYLEGLHRDYRSTYDAFLLCDAPDSPTWPYTREQTAEALAWPGWSTIGPVYRRAQQRDIADVRARYRLDRAPLFVFSMGGGGQHPPYIDAIQFSQFAARVADEIGDVISAPRLVFVRGPYFPSEVAIDSRFEVVSTEPQMPALFAAAHGAIVRAGFNTTWECLGAGTPFLPYVGATYDEPVDDRLSRLRGQGLIAPDLRSLLDRRWRQRFTAACERLTGRWPGTPELTALHGLVIGGAVADAGTSPARVSGRLPRRRARTRRSPLLIRIDDVVDLEPSLEWLLTLFASERIPASLEVIPYLTRLDDDVLRGWDPDASLFVVGQHGYAHVPSGGADGAVCEFNSHEISPPGEEEWMLRDGLSRLRQAFPSRFAGGFSPPYNALPRWLPAWWQQAGGRFISTAGDMPGRGVTPIPLLHAGVDVFDWGAGRMRRPEAVLRMIERDRERRGYAGLILHAHRLRQDGERIGLQRLLEVVRDQGFQATAPPALVRRTGIGDRGSRPSGFIHRLVERFVRR